MSRNILIIIVVLGLIVIGFFRFVKKNVILEKAGRTTETNVVERNGVKTQTSSVAGVVVSWDAAADILEMTVNGQDKKFQIDNETQLIIPKQNTRGEGLRIVPSSDKNAYNTAFCQGDMVNLAIDPQTSKVLMAISNGYRVCGFKE
ncbi:MAG: hypothetical protein WAV41_03695 [Microgenomates group bacterium]